MLATFSQFPPLLLKKPFHFSISLVAVHTFFSNSGSHNLSMMLQGHISHSHLLQIHAQIFRVNAHQDNLVATRLIGHYPSRSALRVFDQLQTPNIFPINAIIRVLGEDGLCPYAFLVFKDLMQRSLSPNDFTFSFLLKACFRSNDSNYVKQAHTHVAKLGFLSDSFICNGLLVSYAMGFEDIISARKVFDEMSDRGMVRCWTSLIAGSAQSGQVEEVLRLFFMMVKENLRPENDTIVSVLSASSKLEAAEIEKWVMVLSEFINGVDSGSVGRDSVNTVLAYLYGKWGKVEKCKERFDEIIGIGKRSVLPWNVIIGAYVQNGCSLEALNLFRVMIEDLNLRPNHVTMVSVISACAQVGHLDLGIWIHEYVKSEGCKSILKSNTFLATALIDMYSKCGSLGKAKDVFEQMVSKDVVSFNSMIMGLAINGEGQEALMLFSKMQELGLHPNSGTFLGVLCACSHSGLLHRGRQILVDMISCSSVPPELEHYACYVDLLARVGLLEEAFEVVASMPFEPNHFVWGALLQGCRLHSKLKLAQDVSQKLVKVDPENIAGYVMFSNALASDQQWGAVSRLRCFMRERGLRKLPGCSWISIDGVVHEFLAGHLSHPQINRIYHTLEGLMKEMKVASA